MKNKALFFSKDKGKKLKCRLLQYLFGALRVKFFTQSESVFNILVKVGWLYPTPNSPSPPTPPPPPLAPSLLFK